MPLRNLPPLVNTVPGAMAIQQTLDRFQWVQQAGNPVSYAPHIRKQPLPGNAAKPVIIQFAKGDKTVPNPTTTAHPARRRPGRPRHLLPQRPGVRRQSRRCRRTRTPS